jgi:hypothetical protein
MYCIILQLFDVMRQMLLISVVQHSKTDLDKTGDTLINWVLAALNLNSCQIEPVQEAQILLTTSASSQRRAHQD